MVAVMLMMVAVMVDGVMRGGYGFDDQVEVIILLLVMVLLRLSLPRFVSGESGDCQPQMGHRTSGGALGTWCQ